MKIYKSTNNEGKRRKSELCKVAANARMAEVSCSHRCSPQGVKGIGARYVSKTLFSSFYFMQVEYFSLYAPMLCICLVHRWRINYRVFVCVQIARVLGMC